MPPAMLAPAWLWTGAIPAASRIAAAIAAVVVLPLVAEISTLPAQAGAERADRVGIEPHQHFPGALVAAAAAQPRERADAPRQRELRRQRVAIAGLCARTRWPTTASAGDQHLTAPGTARDAHGAARRSDRRRRTS